MSTITLSYLVVRENPYKNVFQVIINTTQIKTVTLLKDAIKKKIDDNVKAKDLMLWKEDLSDETKDEHIIISYKSEKECIRLVDDEDLTCII
ncbi:7755_t:CDS:2 [Funneliformis mosseae]|uniref:7755_t:CDS:1 n=1 Tax=Funneliformis mosseae TaxID=27381 RepID=A0A9N9DV77_FUNMO|nr:7755_t:CDS:2 [Funneliformis mosseae]